MPFLEIAREGYLRGSFKPHPSGIDAWLEKRRKARLEPSADLELELGNGRWLHVTERLMSDGGRVSVYNDITDFKKREAELEAATDRFEDAIEAMSSAFALIDADDRLVVYNSRFRDYFPKLVSDIEVGSNFKDMICAGVKAGMFPASEGREEEWLEAVFERRAQTQGFRKQHLEGDIWLQISDHRTKDGGIVSIYADITELKHREIELSRQREILEATLENMNQGITMVDENLDVIAFNKKFLEIFGYSEERFTLGFNQADGFRLNTERGEYGEGDIEEQVRERYELAVTGANEGIWDWDARTGQIFASNRLKTLMGITTEGNMVTDKEWSRASCPRICQSSGTRSAPT